MDRQTSAQSGNCRKGAFIIFIETSLLKAGALTQRERKGKKTIAAL